MLHDRFVLVAARDWWSGVAWQSDVVGLQAVSKLAPKLVFLPRAVRLARWPSLKWHADIDGIRIDIPTNIILQY